MSGSATHAAIFVISRVGKARFALIEEGLHCGKDFATLSADLDQPEIARSRRRDPDARPAV